MVPVETIPGVEEREGWIRREVMGVNSSIIYLTYCKNFCKCHNILSPRKTIKNVSMENMKKKMETLQQCTQNVGTQRFSETEKKN
jgi:hypothetical protein